jgi:protein TonB
MALPQDEDPAVVPEIAASSPTATPELVSLTQGGAHTDAAADKQEATSNATPEFPEVNTAATSLEAVPVAGVNLPPVYPRPARQRGWEGSVMLRVQVSAGGRVDDIWVERSSGYQILDQAALVAVKKWRFRPAQSGGRSVAGLVRVPISFELRGS